MGPLAVVQADILLQRPAQFSGSAVLPRIDFLRLEGAEPTLNHDVVGPAALSVHALADMEFLQKLPVILTGELAALVRVQDARYTELFHRLAYRFQNRLGGQGVRQPPPHNLSAVPVDDGGQVHMALVHLDIGNVNGPDLIRELRHVVSEQIRHNSLLKVSLGEIRLRVYRADTHLFHVLADGLPGHIVPVVFQLRPQPSGSQGGHHRMPVVDVGHNLFLAFLSRPIRLLRLIVDL